MSKLMLALATTVMVGVLVPARGADLPVDYRGARVDPQQYADCGRCGCFQVSYVRHRELRSTYGRNFDPRNFDQTEPYYYFGRMRTYPRYWDDASAAGPRC